MSVRFEATSLHAVREALFQQGLPPEQASKEGKRLYTHLSAVDLPAEGDIAIVREGVFIVDIPLDIRGRNIVIKADRVLSNEVLMQAEKITVIVQTPLQYLGTLHSKKNRIYTTGRDSYTEGLIGSSSISYLAPGEIPVGLTWELNALEQPQFVKYEAQPAAQAS